MSKNSETKQPAQIAELLSAGTTVLTAKTREELAEIIAQIPADCKIASGAVGYSPDTDSFTQKIEIIKD